MCLLWSFSATRDLTDEEEGCCDILILIAPMLKQERFLVTNPAQIWNLSDLLFIACSLFFISWVGLTFFMVIDSPLSHTIANKRDKHTVNKVKDTFDWCYTLWGFSIHMFWFGFDSSCQPIVFTFPWFHWLRRGSGWLGCRLSASRKAAEWVYLLLVERKDLIKWWDGY